ncbi:patched domain-containing protein 3-like [Chiloscyllium plagiosum]|uniref:patched domain-containing protein 3-like n=1 Tax=Chiloscyllium plagiosum TaxID=36176 RepID=UPI001CB83F24|nr:patched domain-containing protein 3-like [Chiloscyllium plagiosum]XP_043546457.1 patched domain-containing protein 3-like [Chiloscyllium plagiosum]XP_043546458.1 patched domain-containing protein 3-like [Chiloscyllium plagiosum]
MAWYQTDCIEKPLCRAFRKLGTCVGQNPWQFLLIPLFVSGGFGAGFCFFAENESNNIEDQFTPINGPAKSVREFIKEHFPTNDSQFFSRQRLYTEGTFASLIAVSKDGNVLTKVAFEEILFLDKKIKDFQIIDNGTAYNYYNLCAKTANTCFSNAVLALLHYDPHLVESTNISYPIANHAFIASTVGGVELDENGTIIKMAKALKLHYPLREDDEAYKRLSLLWIEKFLREFPMDLTNSSRIEVSHFTSVSRQEEFEKTSKRIIPLFSVTYLLSISFSILSCMRLDCVKNKIWVAAMGVISAGLAVLTGFGLLLFCGMSFAINTANAPFLILGIGVDDMFIMLASWQKTQVHSRIEDRLAETYAEAAVSITITTLTDVLAFYIGIMTPFRSVQSFCVYTGTTVLLCFIYNVTFFGAVLALNGRREASNKHWLTFRKVEEDHKPGESKFHGLCCVGGTYDQDLGTESELKVYFFFKKYYGPFLTNQWTKAIVVLLYVGYLTGSIYGCLHIKEGIDLRNLAFDDSYLIKFYDDESNFFSKYGPRVMVTVTDSVKYWDSSVQEEIETCMDRLENNSYVDPELSESWLRVYIDYSKKMSIGIREKTTFIGNLPKLFKFVSSFQQDIELSEDNMSITASRFFIQIVNASDPFDQKNMLIELRNLTNECRIPLLVYHPAFIYFDQFLVIVTNTVQNVIIAAIAMLVISLLLVPNPVCSLWVTFAIASVLVGVAGFMAFWGVNLDSISMINLVVCIGFSVDFTAHITYAFVSNDKTNANERAIDVLYTLGYPILQGALSTILGVAVLSIAGSYIFRTFFKIMFLVIFFGAVHGIVFMPVFLTFLQACGKQHNGASNGQSSNAHSYRHVHHSKVNGDASCELTEK